MSSSSASIYAPNFNNKRNRTKIITALKWAFHEFANDTATRCISSNVLTRVFGQQQKNFNKYIREQILVCTNHYYSRALHHTKTYSLNKEGIEQLFRKIVVYEDVPSLQDLQREALQTRFSDELTTHTFAYNLKSNRYWHPLQFVRREMRDQIMRDCGMQYQYDLESCAQTLLLQYARNIVAVERQTQRRTGRKSYTQKPLREKTPAITEYLKNKNAIRARIANELDIELATAKTIITAIFAGAVLNHYRDENSINTILRDSAKVAWLKQDAYLIKLRKEVAVMWRHIKQVISPKNRLTSKQKWDHYFSLERVVLEAMKNSLQAQQISCFTIHDGFYANQELDVARVCKDVLDQTGYVIQLDKKKL